MGGHNPRSFHVTTPTKQNKNKKSNTTKQEKELYILYNNKKRSLWGLLDSIYYEDFQSLWGPLTSSFQFGPTLPKYEDTKVSQSLWGLWLYENFRSLWGPVTHSNLLPYSTQIEYNATKRICEDTTRERSLSPYEDFNFYDDLYFTHSIHSIRSATWK